MLQKERKHYEVVVEDGKLYYKTSGERVDTPKGNKYIFVMSAAGKLYVGKVSYMFSSRISLGRLFWLCISACPTVVPGPLF